MIIALLYLKIFTPAVRDHVYPFINGNSPKKQHNKLKDSTLKPFLNNKVKLIFKALFLN